MIGAEFPRDVSDSRIWAMMSQSGSMVVLGNILVCFISLDTVRTNPWLSHTKDNALAVCPLLYMSFIRIRNLSMESIPYASALYKERA